MSKTKQNKIRQNAAEGRGLIEKKHYKEINIKLR